MRAAILSLILVTGLAGAAQAQTPPTTSPTTTAQPPAPAGALPPPAAGPAQAAPAQPAPGAPAPTLPTSGDGAAVISILEKVCQPAVRGEGLEKAAKAAGLKENRREGTWTLALGGPYAIVVQPQYSQKDVCQAEIHYAVGQDQPIASALNVWAFLHQPELKLQANYVNVDPDGLKRTRKSWEHFDAASSTAVNFSVVRKPDDTPVNPRFDTGMLFYQERRF